jgi:hypothetical protein
VEKLLIGRHRENDERGKRQQPKKWCNDQFISEETTCFTPHA